MREKVNAKHPFLISHADRSGAEGTHWLGILDIHPKAELFLFYSFERKGLNSFIV